MSAVDDQSAVADRSRLPGCMGDVIMRRFTVSVGSGTIVGDAVGDGPAVVLLHGFSLDRRMWSYQVGPLSERFRVIAYDLRGFGESSPAEPSHSHLDDLIAVLDALHVERAHLVGLSLGANVVLAAAVQCPERVGSLVLMSSGLPGYTWTTPRPPDEVAAYAREHGVEAAKRYWLAHPLFASLRSYPEAERAVQVMVNEFSGQQWRGESRAATLPNVADRIADISAPTLVINGGRDLPGYREIGEVLAANIPGARRVTFSESGHMVPMEQCAEVNEELLRFLENPLSCRFAESVPATADSNR